MEEEDWDLHAVVRGCSTITTNTPTTTTSSVSSSSAFGFQQPSCGFRVGEPKTQLLSLPPQSFEARNSIEELHELCKPFFTRSQPLSLQTSPLSSPVFSFSPAPTKSVQTQEKQQLLLSKRSHQAGSVNNPRSKRRKNILKKVCEVPVENLSSDMWAWRKYGQKPIKGSPYPRGYYRCSSSKGCLARKQVERNRSDPSMFIVTYTSEHNHPAPTHKNSLAGSTRQKPLASSQTTSTTTTGVENKTLLKRTPSPATSGAEEEVQKSEEEGEDEFGFSDIELTDELFESLDELSQLAGDCFVADPFLDIANPSNWVANSTPAPAAAATAAGGSC